MKALTETEKKERGLAILRAAERVMAAHGLEALTMDETAREAGLAKGTLFLYYRNKEELLLAVFSDMTDSLSSALRSAAAAGAPEKALRATVLALLEHFDKKRDITGYAGPLPLAGAHRETLRGRFAANMEAIAGTLRRCAEEGLLDTEDPLFAASALFGLCRGSNSYARNAGRRLPAQERADRVLKIFLDGTRKRE